MHSDIFHNTFIFHTANFELINMATATSTTPVLDAYFERRDKFMKDNDLTDIFMVQGEDVCGKVRFVCEALSVL